MGLTNDLEAGRCVETPSLSEPPKAYTAGKNRSERAPAIPLQTLQSMQNSKVRSRLPQLQSSRDVDRTGEGATASGIELTPTSSEDSEQAKEKSRSDSWSTATFQQLRKSVTSALSCHSTKEDDKEFNLKHGYDQIIHEKVNEFPRGFPRLAALQSSSDDLYIFRGFKRVHARILLQLEVEISQLAKDLDRLDKEDDADPNMWYRLSNTEDDKDWDPRQRELINELRGKIKAYDECLLNNSQIQALGRPPARNYLSFFNWTYTKQELWPTEYQDFIRHESDFVSGIGGSGPSRRSESNYIKERIRSHLSDNPNSLLTRILRAGKQPSKPAGPRIDRYSPFKLALLYRVILVSLSAGILLIPVFLLFMVSMSRLKMLLIVLAFVVLFGAVLSSATDAKIQDVLIGTAAYAAVLVNFLGNLNGNQGCVSANSTA